MKRMHSSWYVASELSAPSMAVAVVTVVTHVAIFAAFLVAVLWGVP